MALLSVCAVRVGEPVSLTVGSVAVDAGHTVILFRRKGGRTDRLPVPPRVRALLEPLLQGRARGEPLFVRASPVTTQRYNRGRRKLDSHAAYRMAAILGGGT
ncbi:hypothetical protein ACIBCT_25515 [Streptosporangium sp. NPDC050855]|uniref:hypothetical protein n=1 Tax=Streptosporangium sp. NPDC050855 TaxID=3366194 RepID=UPI003797D912